MSIVIIFDVVKMCVYSYDIKCQHLVTVSNISYANINSSENVSNVFCNYVMEI